MDAVNGIQPVMNVGGGYGYGDGFGFGGGGFAWFIILFALLGGGNGWGNRGDVASTRDVYASNDFQSLRTAVNNLGNGIADATFALNNTMTNGFAGVNQNVMQGAYAVEKAVTDSRYMIGNAVNENRFAAQQGFNDVGRNIDCLRFDNQINANMVAKAIAEDGEKTRALLVANQMENLKMALAEKDRHLQSAEFALSQYGQVREIIGAVRPFPQPSFLVGNPYGAGCNCGCSCYNG